MRPVPVTLPPRCIQRVEPGIAARVVGVGEAALLTEPLLGSPQALRTTRETALARNLLVLALATEIVLPYLSADSPLTELSIERRAPGFVKNG